ncbi:hypothetical protein [Hugenholtzia roseola]|uniref:hypothetical protein n=1 Tax=Hugenholtzia roseola TaxID=1002 RepID=UPI00040906EB|nr:hypothetical protein [Hugenholtzia roseola]
MSKEQTQKILNSLLERLEYYRSEKAITAYAPFKFDLKKRIEELEVQIENLQNLLAQSQAETINLPNLERLKKLAFMDLEEQNKEEFIKVYHSFLQDCKNVVNNSVINAKNVQIGDNYYNYYSQKPKTHPFYLWVISTTKNEILCSEKLLAQFPFNRYDQTDCTKWKPFEEEGDIDELIAEYKTKVEFEVRERFLAKNPIEEEEKATFLKNLDKIVLVVDPFALSEENLFIAQKFNNDKIGACLVLLCQSVSFELFAYIRRQVEEVFGNLRTCFLDYKEKYLHFIFPISTKDLFFRTLSNIALLRLEIGTEIENGNQQVKKNTFKF